jgi:hypothetical protein
MEVVSGHAPLVLERSRRTQTVYSFISLLAVPGHALLWLSLVKWKRKKRESARL